MKVLKLVVLLAASVAVALAAPASAGKKLEKLDKDSERGKDVGFVLSGSSTPLKKFVLKVSSKPRGVVVDAGGQISCTRNGTTSKGKQIIKSKKAPYKINIKPSVRKNRSCSMSVALNIDPQPKPVKITGKLFKKK